MRIYCPGLVERSMHIKYIDAPCVYLAFCIRISPVSCGEVSGKAYGELVSQLESNEFMSVCSLSNGTWVSVPLCLVLTVPSVNRKQRQRGAFACLWYSCCELPVLPGAVLDPESELAFGDVCAELQTLMTPTKRKKKGSLSSEQPNLSFFPPFT